MFMQSGDIMVMSGPSRLLYHAVPCIVPAPTGQPLPACLQESQQGTDLHTDGLMQEVPLEDWELCSRYLHTSRVNMTVRQVLGDGQAFPTDTTSRESEGSPKDGQHEQQEQDLKAKKKRNSSGYDLDL